MSSDDISIHVDGLSKRYEIYAQPADRLKQMILPRVQRLMQHSPRAYFSEFWALRNVTFDVRRGETVGIVGRNGSGKSTLLQLVCGTLTPTVGVIDVRGRIAALLELGSGFNPEFTGRENVYLNATLLGLSRGEIDRRFDAIVAFADIGNFIEQPVKTYSSGMYVRLAFAVAINVDPEILIVDEALSVGDEAFQHKCFARIDAIRKNGSTILFVSHDAGAVIELCDRAILVDRGELLMRGKPKEVVTTYQKLLYARPDDAKAIRAQILSGDHLSGAPSSVTTGVGHRSKGEIPLHDGISDDVESEDPAYWMPGLQSESVVEYPRHGALISDPRIQTLDGRKVNVLSPGRTYIYTYQVRLERLLTRVRCGMMIRSMTGVELGGAASMLQDDALPIVESGATLGVRFRFRCLLRPGPYFLSAGVLAALPEGEQYVDRRIDVVMFRVMSSVGRLATGFVDFLEAQPEVRVA